MRFHDLRHSFNSRLADIGVIADVRRALMGHSSGGDVNSIYTHIEIGTLRKAIHCLETWHANKLKALEEASLLSSNANLSTEGQTNDNTSSTVG